MFVLLKVLVHTVTHTFGKIMSLSVYRKVSRGNFVTFFVKAIYIILTMFTLCTQTLYTSYPWS